MAKFAGPFPVVKQVFDDAYKLVLPLEIKVQPVFHVLLLKEYFKDSVRPEREQLLRPVSELVENHEGYEVETILNKRKLRSRDTEYLVKWREYHVKEATWVPSSDLGMPRRRCKTLREGPSRENDKRVDEGINSTWRGRVSRTKHERKLDH